MSQQQQHLSPSSVSASRLGNIKLAAHIVPYLHTLPDVVTLFSCSSPVRDVVAPAMMEVLSAGDADDGAAFKEETAQSSWHTDGTTAAVLQHTIYHAGRSATSCMVIRHVDISARHDDTANNFLSSYIGYTGGAVAASEPEEDDAGTMGTSSPSKHRPPLGAKIVRLNNNNSSKGISGGIPPATTSELSAGSAAYTASQSQPRTRKKSAAEDVAAAPIPVTDDVLIRVCKDCVNMVSLRADRANITDTGLTHASVALARNEHFAKISLRECGRRQLQNLEGLSRVMTLTFVDVSMTAVTDAGIAPLAVLPALETLIAIRCLNLTSVDTLAGVGQHSWVSSASAAASSSSSSSAPCPRLITLNITASPVKSIDALVHITSLQHIAADGTRIQRLAALGDSVGLRSISLRNVPAAEEELEALALIPTLEKLSVYNANVESVDFLAAFSNISSLDIGQLDIRTADLSRGRRAVGSGHCDDVDDENGGAAAAAAAASAAASDLLSASKLRLTRLAMRGCPVVETIVIQAMWKNSLEFLDLAGCVRLSDDGVENLECMSLLTSLSLASTAITDATVEKVISKLTSLVNLDLSNTHVSSVTSLCCNSGSGNGVGMPSLKTLRLECCRYFSERGLAGVGDSMPLLEELDLSCTAVRSLLSVTSDAWPSLRRLSLRGVLFAPKGLVNFALARARTLQVLDLTGNNANAHTPFAEVARILRRSSYIYVEGVPYEIEVQMQPEQDEAQKAMRGLRAVQASQAQDRMMKGIPLRQ